MKWIKYGNSHTGEKIVTIKTLRLPDNSNVVHRFRTCTVFKDYKTFSSIPAQARLFMSENGYIGTLITGKNEGYVKVGKNCVLQRSIIVGFNALSKKALRTLIHKTNIYIVEFDGMLVGLENGKEKF